MGLQNATSLAVDFLQTAEGLRLYSYWDSNGFAIGYGNHYYQDGRSVQAGDTITEQDALALLQYYAGANAQAIANQLQVNIPDGLLAALISLRYNCGTITVRLLNLINSGADLETIGDLFKQTCITSDGVYNSDLVQRRQREWELVYHSTNLWLFPAAAAAIALLLFKN
jgi:lysozyme